MVKLRQLSSPSQGTNTNVPSPCRHTCPHEHAKVRDRQKNISTETQTNPLEARGLSSPLMRIIMLLRYIECMCAWWWRGNLRLEDEIDARPARSERLFILRSEGRREIVWTHQQKVTSSLTHQQLRLCLSHTMILCVLICDILRLFFKFFI
jgi:hypothetical protein